MSEKTNRRMIILIIAVTWVLSLLTTLAIMYFLPLLYLHQSSSFSPLSAVESHKILKFQELAERDLTGLTSTYRTNFTWTPNNPSNNLILSVYCTFEYRCENPPDVASTWDNGFYWILSSSISCGQFYSSNYALNEGARNLDEWEQEGLSEWHLFSFRVDDWTVSPRNGAPIDFWIQPNQRTYTITLTISHSDRADSSTPTYIKNINVVLEVIDGT